MTPFRRRVLGPEVQSCGSDWSVGDDLAAPPIGPAPQFTVVVPVWNTEPDALRAMFASVQAQRYPAWDMSVVDDASTRSETRDVLADMATDPRVRLTRLERNSGIGHATRTALAAAHGEWIAFVDHDDVLHAEALVDVARLVGEVPELEMVYTDQDRLRGDGTIGDPAFKSAWSPDLLRSTNCIVHLCCYRRSLLDSVGGIREGFDGSQDYDLLLRMSDHVDVTRIGHVARPRYHWRASPGSVAADPDAKPWAFEAAERALTESLRRRRLRGRIEPHDVLGWYHTRYEIEGHPRATVILVGDEGTALDATRASVAAAASAEVGVVETSHARTGTAAAAMAADARSELAVFVAAGVVVRAGWLDALAEHAQQPEVGIVGGCITDGNGGPTFGLVVGHGADAVTPATPAIAPDDFAWSGRVVRNLSAVSLQLAATRPDVVRAAGWDAALSGDLMAADLCLRIRRQGLRVVSTPHAEGHGAQSTVGHRPSARDTRRFRANWELDVAADPFLHPNRQPPPASRPPARIRRAIRRVARVDR